MVGLVEQIDALLPQTQCARCGHPGCRPYAEAIVRGEAELNQCPPGGEATIAQLAELLGRPVLPLDPARGGGGPPQVAVIDEGACIGCAHCLPPCPVDAIVGARRQLHTVLESWCTGCELCIAPCPVDCIRLEPRALRPAAGPAPDAHANRRRYEAHGHRSAARVAARESMIMTQKTRAG